jgi:UDP-glucuronate 4-epimerase
MDKTPTPRENKYTKAKPPYQIYNIGNNSPVTLGDFIAAIEDSCGQSAVRNLLPMQPGDVPTTYADVNALVRDIDFKPATTIESGVKKFVDWYLRTESQQK